MIASGSRLTLTRVRATAFRDTTHAFLIQLRGQLEDGRQIEGFGEARPGRSSSAVKRQDAWELLAECLKRLHGREIVIPGDGSLGRMATALLEEFHHVAKAQQVRLSQERKTSLRAGKIRSRAAAKRLLKQGIYIAIPQLKPDPFQGTLLGLEAAIADLITKAVKQPPSKILGRRAAHLSRYMPHPFGTSDQLSTLLERVLQNATDYVAYPEVSRPKYAGQEATTYTEIPYLKPLGSNGTKGHLLERVALSYGLSTTRFSKGAFIASDGERPPLLFKWSRSPNSSAVSLALCTHKEATRLRLRRAGLPVPAGRTFAHGDFKNAELFAERIGYPVVVKPAMGVRGIGVVANIRNRDELRNAFNLLTDSRLGKGDFIVEKHIPGRDYRIVVAGDKVIAAILREPASVQGDGEHTVAELIVNKNAARRLNPHLWGRPIKYNSTTRYQLERAGLDLSHIPEEGQTVLLSSSCSLSQGGDSIDVLDELHPSIKEACVRAVKAVPGLWFCGIDFLLEDHTKPLEDQQAGICELNAHAAIGNCEYPLYGSPREVARTVMEHSIRKHGLRAEDKPADHLALRLTIRGKVTRVGYRSWLRRHALNFGISGWVRNVDSETVEAILVGETPAASALAAAAVLGPRRAAPTSVSTEHIDPESISPRVSSDFEILPDSPKE